MKTVRIGTPSGEAHLKRLKLRARTPSTHLEEAVEEILERVRERGDGALVEYNRRFDCPGFTEDMLRVPAHEIKEAQNRVEPEFMKSLEKAIKNIEAFHQKQVPHSWFTTREDGTIMGQMVTPVGSCGLYCPGGKGGETPLVSTVLMNAVPARIAGVPRIVMVTPPSKDGSISPYLLAAAGLSGVHEVYRVGSAWAVGALAFGTETIEPVDVIVGPGNIFVTLAKKLVAGLVGIDMVAGPSEVLIIADASADPGIVAADLLSQAEHDPMATSILITADEGLCHRVSQALEAQMEALPRSEIAKEALEKNGVSIIVSDLDEAVSVANRIAPEHLELLVRDPWALLAKVKNAGAIFLGHNTPEPVGDYIAGPNHVLPTMGTARFSSALSVETFLKRSSVISYSKAALTEDGPDVVRLARTEGLEAHARSVLKRLS